MWQSRRPVPAAGELQLSAARKLVLDCLPAPRTAAFQLDAALGRVLYEGIRAVQQLPPFDSSAMDGFAIRALDVAEARQDHPALLRLVAESRTGHPPGALESGQAIAISAGAPMPDGADTVLRIEGASCCDGSVWVSEPLESGTDVRLAGEDIPADRLVLLSGVRLGPTQIGMLAALGRSEVLCACPPRVSLILTGDAPPLGRIQPPAVNTMADSNRHSIAAAIRCCGAIPERVVTVSDERAALADAIAAAALDSDLLILCGGMSVGAHDHVRPALRALGAQQAFWGLALKPGHPTWFGRLQDVPVLGLPGNPVSATVAFTLLGAPLLQALQGARPNERPLTAALGGGYRKPAGRTHAICCRLTAGPHGWCAEPTGPQESHIQSSMLDADAFALIPATATEIAPGECVEIEPFVSWSGGVLR